MINQQIDFYLRHYLAESRGVGLAIAVAQGGEISFCAGYGVQDLRSGQPVTAETLFHLASVVKTMTSTAILQLREAGKLDLDDPIVRHLPYFRVADPRSDQITIRQCLSHTSGIGHPEDWAWDNPEFDDGALERHVRGLTDHQLVELAPGTFSYSDIAYNVLGDLIAKVAGMSYESYLYTQLFQPLGMTKTTTMPPRQGDPALLAIGYEQDADGVIKQSHYPYNRIHVPCGCIASNVLEMTRYATAQLRRAELDGVRVLQPESYTDLWTIQARDAHPDAEIDSALGWWVRRGTVELVVSHSGADDGFVSHLRLWTQSQLSL